MRQPSDGVWEACEDFRMAAVWQSRSGLAISRKSPSLVELLHSCRQARPSLSILSVSYATALVIYSGSSDSLRGSPALVLPSALALLHVISICLSHSHAMA